MVDRKHEEYNCKQTCFKSCPNDHPCPLECYKGCEPCKVIVERQLQCDHTVEMKCSDDVNTFQCYIKVCDEFQYNAALYYNGLILRCILFDKMIPFVIK